MTEPRSQTLVLPYLAPNLNDLIRATNDASSRRGAARYRAKVLRKKPVPGRMNGGRDMYTEVKAQWATRIFAHVLEQHILPFPAGAHLAFTIVEPTRRRDPDNLCSGVSKLVLDGLVKCHVLPTDGWDGVLSLSFAWEQGPRPMVRVTLKEAV
jgi:hypothetical protein